MLAVDVDLKPLVEAARAGDAGAWDRLFQRYQLPLYAYVFELVRQEQTSLDIVQETFVNAVRYLGSLRDEAKFGSWLFGIAHQKCVQQWRRQSRERRVLEATDEPPENFADAGPDPGELLLRQEQEEELMQLLDHLPPPQRSVVLLHFLEDFTLEEIAAISGTALGTVKSRLHYAKRMLRQLIEDES